jgi:hypothetical protein
MLRSIRNLFENKLGASDGEIGHVNDFYFDDRNWAVRYLVADTGSWMPGRLVLISPHSFGGLYQGGKTLLVNLTRQQIENGPSIDLHKPLSRHHEEEYHRHFGWPFHWDGGRSWGMSVRPDIASEAKHPPYEQTIAKGVKHETSDPHLRSVKTVLGYHVQATDGAIGHAADFLLSDENWVIQRMVVDTRRWMSGKRVMILPNQINRISWNRSKIYVDLTKESVLGSQSFDQLPSAFGNTTRDFLCDKSQKHIPQTFSRL